MLCRSAQLIWLDPEKQKDPFRQIRKTIYTFILFHFSEKVKKKNKVLILFHTFYCKADFSFSKAFFSILDT